MHQVCQFLDTSEASVYKVEPRNHLCIYQHGRKEMIRSENISPSARPPIPVHPSRPQRQPEERREQHQRVLRPKDGDLFANVSQGKR